MKKILKRFALIGVAVLLCDGCAFNSKSESESAINECQERANAGTFKTLQARFSCDDAALDKFESEECPKKNSLTPDGKKDYCIPQQSSYSRDSLSKIMGDFNAGNITPSEAEQRMSGEESGIKATIAYMHCPDHSCDSLLWAVLFGQNPCCHFGGF